MKRTLLVFSLGLAGGALAYLGWFSSHRPLSADDPFAWLKSDLRLTTEQFSRIKTLHEQSSPQLLALASQVAHMRAEFAEFERERRASGEIDFLEFARFVEQRREVNRECAESTRRLILAATDVMTAPQRERYLTFLGPALKIPEASPFN